MPYDPLDPSTAQAAPATSVGGPLAGNGLSLADLRAELRLLLMGRTDVGDSRLDLYINLAYTDMVTSLKIEEMKASIAFTLAVGQPLYLLPSAVHSTLYSAVLLDAADERGRPLEKTDLITYRSRPIREGEVEEVFRYQKMLVLWPTPDEVDTLSLDFRIKPAWLAAETDCPILDPEWHEGILLLAKQKLLGALQEWEASMAAENDYVKFVRKRLDVSKEEEENKVVRSSVPRSSEMLRRRRGSATRRNY